MSINRDTDQDSCCLCRAINHFRNSDAGQHIRNARREMLLAAKSLIEICIEKLDEKAPSKKEGNQAHKVEIN